MTVISLFFSVAIYHASVQEFDRDFRAQADFLMHGPGFGLESNIRDKYIKDRAKELEAAKVNLFGRLLFTNVVILVGAGALSYYLARRSLEPIEEAHEAQQRFTADASHELRTPLTAMQTEIEVALMNPKLTLADAKKQLGSNLEELARLTVLSEGLLKLASLQGNGLDQSPVLVEDIISTAVQRVAPLAEQKKMLIKAESPKDLTINGDETSLVEVLTILLENAVKYSPAKSEIKVNAIKSQRHVNVKIEDKGQGIKEEALPHLFERFYRADTSRSQGSANGYGLGLAIAKNIVELHDGSITVTSKPGKGSTFTVHLPL